MSGRAGPVTGISVTGMKIFAYEHSSPVTGLECSYANMEG